MRRHLAFCTAALAAALLSLGLLAGSALAASRAPAPKPTTKPAPKPPTNPAPAPPPVAAKLRLSLAGTFRVRHHPVTVGTRLVKVHGVVRPYVPGQWVKVREYLGRRRFKTARLRIKRQSAGVGAFTAKLQAPAPGFVHVQVAHHRTAQMAGFSTRRSLRALDPSTGPGEGGLIVSLVQERLAALHIYVLRSGVFDEHTALALDAYHRLLGRGEGDTGLDARTVADLLAGRGAFRVRYPHDGKHVEGDLGHQLVALIRGSRVYRIYPISSGKPSTPTVLGRFRVYRRVPGYLPDGMYFSSFFYRGYALHGYNPAPDYPASHGCMRLPIDDAVSVFRWLTYGDRVDVYQ